MFKNKLTFNLHTYFHCTEYNSGKIKGSQAQNVLFQDTILWEIEMKVF